VDRFAGWDVTDDGSAARPDPAAGPPPVLPAEVRRALVRLAAEVLGGLEELAVPAALRRVRSFAPVQRGKAGAGALALALEGEAGFRARVAAAWRRQNPEVAQALDGGGRPPALDPATAVAGLYLARPHGWRGELDAWLERLRDPGATPRAGEEGARAGGPGAELEQARAGRAGAEAERDRLAEEVAARRREQRRLRADADRARAATRAVEQRLAEQQERAAAQLRERDELTAQARKEAQEAREQLAGTRLAARAGRTAGDVRTRLLLDTIVDAAAALRRELALPPAAQTPADLVAAQLAGPAEDAAAVPPARGLAADDPEILAELLRLPRAHLVVDGYNVTMAGYGNLPLADQRRLLVDGLAAVAARTAAEVTCCFDGADVAARPAGLVRGVRVLFSDPGMTADELIRRLVRAEPTGRVVVVASSDREVADGVLAAGARPVPSSLLLALLGAGRSRRA
jgi:predicted RNA-binding protein with PIN domain